MARQADGAVYVQYGETAVLVTATADRKPTHLPFFPLTVEYREKTYAAGKFPGGFIKRETRPGEKETISARQIDRPLRPLFPADYRNDTQVVCFIISADQENDADVIGMLGASTALLLSPIPWDGPVAGVRVARREDEWLVNPTFDDLEMCDLEIVVAGSEDSIVMVEGACLEATEDEFLEAMQVGQKAIAELIGLQRELVRMAGAAETFEYEPVGPDPEVVAKVTDQAAGRVGDALRIADKEERGRALSALRAEVTARLEAEHPDCGGDVGAALRKLEKETMRRRILEDGERIDGRGMNDVRDITCEVGLLPRTHGSALFTRGQTQALAVTTLGTVRDEQRIDSRRCARRNLEVLHAPLQLPRLFDGRSADVPGYEPPRDGTRHAGRARASGAPAGVRGFSVHDPRRLRYSRIERVELDGFGLRRIALPDGCRSADAGPVRGDRNGAHQGGRPG